MAAYLVVGLVITGLWRSYQEAPQQTSWRELFTGHRLPLRATLITFALTAAAVVVLWTLSWLRVGLWSLVGGWGAFTTGINSQFPSAVQILISAGCIGMWMFVVPTVAVAEEMRWRTPGQHRWRSAVLFCAMHVVVGMPLAWAIAMMIPVLRLHHVAANDLGDAAREHALFNVFAAVVAVAVVVKELAM